MYQEQRLKKILTLLEDRENLSVKEMVDELDVSKDTVRRDFDCLSQRNLAQRTHGGILPVKNTTVLGFQERQKGLTEDKKKMAEILSISLEDIEKRIYRLKDENPMLGHRGCRLGVSYPELYRIQARAIIEAAYECAKEGIKVHPEIMIPFIMESKELAYIREEIEEEIEAFFREVGATVEYKLGTMIEIPRACLLADEIAEYADFFSFGTNDLTQMSMGLSRDDSVKFLDAYREKGIWEGEPFYSIDTKAVTPLLLRRIGAMSAYVSSLERITFTASRPPSTSSNRLGRSL